MLESILLQIQPYWNHQYSCICMRHGEDELMTRKNTNGMNAYTLKF